LFAELLKRRVGPEAARAWLTAMGPLAKTNDPLVNAVAERH
jgi:hypothetical protein